jgi:hypothetical protein
MSPRRLQSLAHSVQISAHSRHVCLWCWRVQQHKVRRRAANFGARHHETKVLRLDTGALKKLAKAELIQHKRGLIRVLDRNGLKAASNGADGPAEVELHRLFEDKR